MPHEVGRERLDALRRAVDGVDDGDGCLEPRPLCVIQPHRVFVGGTVDIVLARTFGERHLDEPRLEVHRDGRAVADGPREVVDVDVVAEHCTRIALRERDRRAGEGDERRVRQRITQVTGVAIEVVIVAAVGFIDNDDHVAPVGEQGCCAPEAFSASMSPNFCNVVK